MTDKVQAEQAQEPVKNPLEKSVDITISQKDLQDGIKAELNNIRKKVKMPGFRVGHVPMPMVQASYGQEAFSKTLDALIQKEYQKAALAAGLMVAGPANVEQKPTGEGEDLQFTLTVECMPEFEVPALDSIEFKRYSCAVGEAEVNKTLDIITKQRVTFEVEEGRVAQNDDKVTINFKGTKDGTPFEGGSAEGFDFVLGQGRMLADFEAAVTGMKAGETKTFDLTFPADYGSKELAGQTVQFEVTCVTVAKAIVPVVDADFAKSLGMDSVDALMSEVRSNLEREVADRVRARNKEGVINALLEAIPFAVPKAMLEDTQKDMSERMARDMAARMGTKTIKPLPVELFAEGALKQCRTALIFGKLIKDLKIEVTKEDVEARAKVMASAFEDSEEMIKWMMQDRAQYDNLAAVIREDKMIDLILEKGKTTDEAVEFDQLMHNGQA